MMGLLWSWPALATAEGGNESDSLATVVLLLLFVGAAYLLTHYVVDQLQRRLLFKTGAEYIVLGILLGPAVPQLHVFDDLTPLAPIIALAAGWIGLVRGMELDISRMATVRDNALRIVLIEMMGTGTLVTLAAHAVFASGWLGAFDATESWTVAAVMGCTAVAGSSSAISLLENTCTSESALLGFLRRTSRGGDALSIAAFGLVFCLFHEGATATVEPPNASDWVLVTMVLGAALGVLFTVFLDDDEDTNGRFLTLIGIITFASGAAFFLNLSVITVTLFLGIAMVNTSRSVDRTRETLAGTSRPMTLILLVFAGALWRPAPLLPTAVVAIGYMGLRTSGKLMSCWLASLGTPLRRDLGRGLLAQGDVAIAITLAFALVYEGPAVDIAYSAILASVVLHELVAPRFLKGLLVDAGEVRTPLVAEGG